MIKNNLCNFICGYNYHKFVCCALGFESITHKDPIVNMRRLNDANLIEINKLIEISDFSLMHGPDSVDQKWIFLKNSLLELINTVAPFKQIKLKCHDQNSPWFDSEMRSQFKRKDYLYNVAMGTQSENDWELFKLQRSFLKRMKKEKIISYFADKTSKDFKNSKKFWKFYSTTIKVKSHEKSNELPPVIHNEDEYADDPASIAKLFNKFFTTISFSSSISDLEFIYLNIFYLQIIKKID